MIQKCLDGVLLSRVDYYWRDMIAATAHKDKLEGMIDRIPVGWKNDTIRAAIDLLERKSEIMGRTMTAAHAKKRIAELQKWLGASSVLMEKRTDDTPPDTKPAAKVAAAKKPSTRKKKETPAS